MYINFYGSKLFYNKSVFILGKKKGFTSSLELLVAHGVPGGSE